MSAVCPSFVQLLKSCKLLQIRDDVIFCPDVQDIFSLGFVNSLFAMQLVLFVEKEFHLDVSNEDLDIDIFRTVNAIATLIEQKHAQQPQSVSM